jgi:hypothetical protein
MQAAAMLGKPAESLNLIVGHLGAGASVTAVKGGVSVDTSMGLTPLEGCCPIHVVPYSACLVPPPLAMMTCEFLGSLTIGDNRGNLALNLPACRPWSTA